MMSKFEEVYRKIATNKNYIQPNYPRLDNWAIDRYEAGEFFAAISDGGYRRWVGRYSADGKVLWRVNDYYPKPLEYVGISVDDFESLVV
jgi:hypothetical protein